MVGGFSVLPRRTFGGKARAFPGAEFGKGDLTGYGGTLGVRVDW